MGDGKEDEVDGLLDCFTHGLKRAFKPPTMEGELSGYLETPDYDMKHPRGKCYIFNNKVFEMHTKMKERRGTDLDAENLKYCFKKLGFDVYVFQDYTVAAIRNTLKKAQKEQHSKYNCLVCCILTHGSEGKLYGADGDYETETVFEWFRGDKCISLASKPKLFFIQACQGDKYDDGIKLQCKESCDSGDVRRTFKIPTQADFLVAYSSVPGYYSWRDIEEGSWFIQALVTTLHEHANEMDLLSILTIVNRKVAYYFESSTHKKQMPVFRSTLTKNVNFAEVES